MRGTPRRVGITGLGVVTAIGSSVQDFFEALVAGRSGVRRLTGRSDTVAACVEFSPEAHFSKLQLTALDRFAQFALVAADQAMEDAGLATNHLARSRLGIYFGSGIGGAQTLESSYRAYLDPTQGRVSPMTIVLTMANAAAAHISLRYGVSGPSLTYSIACASAAVAIGEAFRAIRDGYLDQAIVGGAEALLTPGMVAGWNAMHVLAVPDEQRPESSCRPFSLNRSGLVLGEGAGVLILETIENANRRGYNPVAEIAGYGVSSDASHLTKPSCEGQAAAMRMALDDAQLPASAIGYINAHATATQVGDVTETAAIKKVFGSGADRVAVSSTKALHGHLLGASGAVELIAAVMALRTGTIPPTCHYEESDPLCDLDYVPNVARKDNGLRAVMSNSFAFGGTNAVLVARSA